MAIDTSASYKLLVEWTNGTTVTGSIGEVHTFYGWTVELGISSQQLQADMEYYDGSSPDRPLWFELVDSVEGSFLGLSDTPVSYAGQAQKAVAVKADETGVEFVALGAAAYLGVGVLPGTVMAGDDPRLDSVTIPDTAWLAGYAKKSGRGHYDLEAVYGLNSVNGPMKLNQLYTQPTATAKFAKLFSWYVAAGWDTADIMQMRHGPACHNEALLQGHTAGNWGTGRIDSRNGITWPAGVYHHNTQSIIDAGQYIGKGTTNSYTGGGGTTLVLDKAGWLGSDPYNMNIFQSSVGEVWNGYSYVEGTLIDQFRFEGLADNKYHETSYESAGVFIRGAGEVWSIGRIKTNGFNGYGLKNTGGTPLECQHISTFSNTLGGIGLIGGSLSTNYFGVVSADDNPCIFRVLDGYGNRSGGNVFVGLVKNETNKRTPFRNQILVEADGFTGPESNEGSFLFLKVGVMQYDANYGRTHALCVVRGFQDGLIGATVAPRKARVQIDSVSHWNSDFLMHCLGTNRAWANDADYTGTGFVWNGSTGVLSRPTADGTAPSPVARTGTRRLGFKTVEANWDLVPAYDETNGGTIIPDPAFGSDWIEDVGVGIVPSSITTGDTAQGYAQPINVDYRLRSATITWSIISGPATINSSTGVITPTGTGLVKVQAQAPGTSGFGWLQITA